MIDGFARTTDEVLSLDEFRDLLESGRKLKIKFGADVTAPFLHLGHAVNLWMMREMQERGHLVQFLIGDFTTRIGDPTGRDAARRALAEEEMETNARAFVAQIGKVLITDDPEVFEIRRNSEWFGTMGTSEFLSLASRVTHSRLISRDMFRRRVESGSEIRMNELLYPILQGWDSVMLGSDLTIVGSDQLFNESMGRTFQAEEGMRPQVVLTTRITPGLDGVNKQSKSLNNFIALTDGPRDMFGKAMSLPDRLIPDWMEVYTSIEGAEIASWRTALASAEINPRDAKLRLARAIVERYHGPESAANEADWFGETFSRRAFPEDAPALRLHPGDVVARDLVVMAMGCSGAESRRLIASRACELDGRTLTDVHERLQPASGARLRIGKRGFFRIARD